MGISVEDAIKYELVSSKLIESLPANSVCKCGSKLEFSDSLRQLYCTNGYCYLKIAKRLEYMLNELKVPDWSLDDCTKVTKSFRMKSPYQAFLLSQSNKLGEFGIADKVDKLMKAKDRVVSLWEMVKMGNIPVVSNIAYKLFCNYDSIDKAYEDIEKFQVPMIADKLGLNNTNSSVIAVLVYKTLIEYKDELKYGETQFTISKEAENKISIAINGRLSGFNNNSDFMRFISRRYGNIVSVHIMGNVTAGIEVLVSDTDTRSSRYRNVCRMNSIAEEENTGKIKIMSSNEFIKYMDDKYLEDKREGEV